jgi:hypothetical protein
MRARTLLAVLAVAVAAAPAAAQESYLLVVSGLSGEPVYADRYHGWALSLLNAAEKKLGLPADHLVYLAEDPGRDPSRIRGRSTREGIEGALRDLAGRLRAGDFLLVLLIGHGSYQDGRSRFNVPGRDMTDEDLAAWLRPLSEQRLAVVVAASASGEWVKALTGRNRVVVTAARSGSERNETTFAGPFVEAFAGDGADADKDQRVSVLEAFQFARHEVERDYEKRKLLLTEHAVLEDDGDGVATGAPDPTSGDGALARGLFLDGAGGTADAEERAGADPRTAALLRERRDLEDRVDALVARKGTMEEGAYAAELERLLLELAAKSEEIRSAGEEEP